MLPILVVCLTTVLDVRPKLTPPAHNGSSSSQALTGAVARPGDCCITTRPMSTLVLLLEANKDVGMEEAVVCPFDGVEKKNANHNTYEAARCHFFFFSSR